MDKDSFHFERDLIIGALYLSPERSTVYKEGKTGIDLLEEKIAQVLDEYDDTDLILGGDFNSRTSDMDDYIILDNPDFIPELSEIQIMNRIPVIFQGIVRTRSLTTTEESL